MIAPVFSWHPVQKNLPNKGTVSDIFSGPLSQDGNEGFETLILS